MAGDWIKIEHALPDKPEVFRLADLLGIDPDAVVGKLVRLWVWCDQQTVDGNALGVTDAFLDRITHQPGFSVALRKVGWLQVRSGSLAIPRFDRHNGQTAKARAVTNRRVAAHRNKRNAVSVTDVTLEPLQKPLPEKRREEYINTPSLPRVREDGGELPDWFTPELTEAWNDWLAHLRERDARPTRITLLTWQQEIQRHGIPKAIEALRFSISKGAKSILWDGPFTHGAGAPVRQEERKARPSRPQQPPRPSMLFKPGEEPEGVKINQW